MSHNGIGIRGGSGTDLAQKRRLRLERDSEPIPGVKCEGCESDRCTCTFVGGQGACVMCTCVVPAV